MLGGQAPHPLAAAPPRVFPRGPAPLALSPIYRGVRGGLQYTTTQGAAPPLPNTSPPPYVLGEALSEYCRIKLHHAVVLPLELPSSTSPSSLLDQDGGDVSRPVRVLNAEVLSVQH